MRTSPPLPWFVRIAPALAASSALGLAWAWDARRRQDRAALLHRTLVELLLNAMSAGDPVTERHCRRVANLTDVLGGLYGLSAGARTRLRLAALLHDLGKIDDQFFHIVHSWEPLSEDERTRIRRHPDESAHILEPLERVHPGITDIVEAHHECWNGQGYPRQLQGHDIPLEARLISVADVFDALTQPRAYHEPLSVDEAIGKIRGSAAHRFDPEVIRRLEQSPGALRRWREIADEGRRQEQAEADCADAEATAAAS